MSVTFVTVGELTAAIEMLYGGMPPLITIPHGSHVARFPVLLARMVNDGEVGSGTTQLADCPSVRRNDRIISFAVE